MTFEEIYQIVEESSHETAFNLGECEELYNLCMRLPKGGHALEIGVQFGRSLTVIGMVAKERGYDVTGVDNWCEDESPQVQAHISGQIRKYDMPVVLLSMTSEEASELIHHELDLIHIDGDHTYEGVKTDIELWKDKVKSGGYLLFDDYGHNSLPDVFQAVNEFIHKEEFEYMGRYGQKLGVFKKL